MAWIPSTGVLLGASEMATAAPSNLTRSVLGSPRRRSSSKKRPNGRLKHWTVSGRAFIAELDSQEQVRRKVPRQLDFLIVPTVPLVGGDK